jgi:hypothetical protein
MKALAFQNLKLLPHTFKQVILAGIYDTSYPIAARISGRPEWLILTSVLRDFLSVNLISFG